MYPFAIVVWVIWFLMQRPTEKNWIDIFKGLGLGTAAGTCVGLGGFFLAETPRTNGMGYVMFLLVPFCAGFAIATVTRGRNTVWASALLAVVASLVSLVAGKLEGLLCAILASPLLVLALGIGAILGSLFRRHLVERLRHQVTGMTVIFAFIPVLLLTGHRAEVPALDSARREVVSNSIFLHAAPQEVWLNIQSIDSIDAAKLC